MILGEPKRSGTSFTWVAVLYISEKETGELQPRRPLKTQGFTFLVTCAFRRIFLPLGYTWDVFLLK